MLMTVAGSEWEEIGDIWDPRMARVGSEYTAGAGGNLVSDVIGCSNGADAGDSVGGCGRGCSTGVGTCWPHMNQEML